METTNHASGLGEAFASYQPTSMPTAQWARFRDDAVELVLRLHGRETEAARVCLSRLVVCLADQSSNRPHATLADLFTPDQVQGYLERCLAAGEARGTVQNRQGSLNSLLAVRAGNPVRRQRRRQAEPHLQPYTSQELQAVLDAAAEDGTRAAVGLARTLLCGLAGQAVPTGEETVRIEIDGRTVAVGDLRWEAPDGLLLPPSGTLDGKTVDAGRMWGQKRLSFVLDLRRLELTYITRLVETLPALVTVRLAGVGRDRLTAATPAASRPSPDVQTALLRGSDRRVSTEGEAA